jgi:hypothetical protein
LQISKRNAQFGSSSTLKGITPSLQSRLLLRQLAARATYCGGVTGGTGKITPYGFSKIPYGFIFGGITLKNIVNGKGNDSLPRPPAGA